MGILASVLKPAERRLSDAEMMTLLGGARSAAGVGVNAGNAMTLAAVFACVRVIADNVGMLPLITYRRLSNGGKMRAADHPLYPLLHDAPNSEMGAYEFRRLAMAHMLAWGNAYAEVVYGDGGQVQGLYLLRPDRMELMRRGGALVYVYRLDSEKVIEFNQSQILHLRDAYSGTGLVGNSRIKAHAEEIGFGMALREFGNRYFGNGARPGVVLKHPGRLSAEAAGRLKADWSVAHEGLTNAHRVAVLEEGMGLETIGIPPEESQFLESRKYSVTEIARIYGVPPHKIGDLDRATWGNIEHQQLDFVQGTLQPHLVNIEQAITRTLLQPSERQTVYVEHLIEGLLRGDTATRYNVYVSAVQNGIMTRNEIRLRENLNPVAGGDEFLVPLNLAPVGSMRSDEPAETRCSCGDTDHTTETRAEEGDILPPNLAAIRRERQRIARRQVGPLSDAAGRLVRRETADLRRAVSRYLGARSVDGFRKYLDRFYEDLRGVVGDYFAAQLIAYAQQSTDLVTAELGREVDFDDAMRGFVQEFIDTFAGAWVARSQRQIDALLDQAQTDGTDPAALVSERLDGWDETRPGKEADRLSFEALNAFVIKGYVLAGVTRIMWAARGDSCPFCRKLSGKVAGIHEHFIKAGDSVTGGEGDEPMLVRGNTRHGPLHQGCDCVTVAA